MVRVLAVGVSGGWRSRTIPPSGGRKILLKMRSGGVTLVENEYLCGLLAIT